MVRMIPESRARPDINYPTERHWITYFALAEGETGVTDLDKSVYAACKRSQSLTNESE